MKLLMKGKEVIEKIVTHEEHKDTTTRMEIKWIETKNYKTIYELVAP
jgi:DNA transposition AAA+ family ATPase